MKKAALLKRFINRWWGLPLILALLLMPLSSSLSVRLWIPGGYVYLIYLPLAMMIAMLMVFDWAALPGIFIALCFHYFFRYTHLQAVLIISIFLVTLTFCWWGYRNQEKVRWGVSFGELHLATVRLFLAGICYADGIYFAESADDAVGYFTEK